MRDIVKVGYDKALGILTREKALLERWAQKLLEKETLVEAELEELKNCTQGFNRRCCCLSFRQRSAA